MTQYELPRLVALAAAAALSFGSPALAATAAKPAAKVVVKPVAKPHPVAAKPAPKPMVAVAKPRPAAVHAPAPRPAAQGRMVRARLANGQVVTYNCSLPGNQTKQACKR